MVFLREELAPDRKGTGFLICLPGTLICGLSLLHPVASHPQEAPPHQDCPPHPLDAHNELVAAAQLAWPLSPTLLYSFHQPQKRSSRNLRVFRWMTFKPILQKKEARVPWMKVQVSGPGLPDGTVPPRQHKAKRDHSFLRTFPSFLSLTGNHPLLSESYPFCNLWNPPPLVPSSFTGLSFTEDLLRAKALLSYTQPLTCVAAFSHGPREGVGGGSGYQDLIIVICSLLLLLLILCPQGARVNHRSARVA